MSTNLSKQQWAKDFLAGVGNLNPSPYCVGFVWGWEQMESGAADVSPADFNPLNTTQGMPGSTNFNSAGVQNFVNYQQGLAANVQVIKNSLYPTLLTALAGNNDAALASAAVAGDLSVWVSGRRSPIDTSYVASILQLANQHGGAPGGSPVNNVILNSRGMVANFVPVSQFERLETEFACGFFAGASLRSATPPTMPTRDTAETVDQWADQQYADVYGSFGANQTGGISIDQLHQVLHNGGLHYWDLPISASSRQVDDLGYIKRSLAAGHPVAATVIEASIEDLTGDIPVGNPYNWFPGCTSASCPTHVLIWVGVDSNGNLLAVDYANVVGPLQGNNSVRPWPRHYNAAKVNNTFATLVQLVGPDANKPWLKTPIDPTNIALWNGYNAQNTEFWIMTPPGLPGWNDDGNTLTDPNGFALIGAVRTNVLSGWDPNNVVMGTLRIDQPDQACLLEDGRWGKGDLFFFHDNAIVVAWAPDPVLTGGKAATNVTFRIPTGNELFWARREITDLKAQVAALQAQLAAQPPVVPPTPTPAPVLNTADALTQIDTIITAAAAAKSDLTPTA